MNRKFLLCLIIGLFSSLGFAQEMNVKGTIYDSTGTKPLLNAMVMAVRVRDSLLLGFTRSEADGQFELKGFEVDTFSLIIEHPSYDSKTYYIFGHADNYEINIPKITMPPRSQEIEEVVIYAYKDPIYYKGDTLVYVADSFKVAEGAVVEDLLKKLPGLDVDKDGKITSQGQEINKVLVDGDEFFGSDPTIATKNLGADGIETVQVYEKENEDDLGSDEKIKILDLKLKADAKKGYFGRISGASDLTLTQAIDDNNSVNNPFYEGELLLNKFNGSQKLSVFALGSNTPRSNFGWGDVNRFGLENESFVGNRWNQGNNQNTSGIPQTLKAGVYYSDKFGKKKQTKIGFNYSYYNDILDASSASQSQYFLSDTTYITDDSTRNYSRNESHRFNVNFSTQLDSLTTLDIKPSVRYDIGKTKDSDISKFFGSDLIQSLATDVQNNSDSKGYTVNGMAKLNRKFKKKKRELELRYDLAMVDNHTDASLLSTSDYILAATTDSVDQQKYNDNATTSHYGQATYVEPLSKKVNMELEYLFEYGYSFQDKKTYDNVNGAYTGYRADLSNDFDNNRMQNRGGLKFVYKNSKHTVSLGSYVRNIQIDNINKITSDTINQNISNILPNFRYEFKPSMSKRFNFNYRTSSAQPQINDLQPVPDNSNPNRIKEGNPDLKPNYTHTVNVMFNTWNALSGKYIWIGGMYTLTNNAFANSTSYDQYGRTVTKTINVDGNMFATIYGGAGLNYFGRKLDVQPGLNGNYFRNSNWVSGQENITDNYGITPSLGIDLNLLGDSLEIETKVTYSYNNAISSLNKTATPYSIETYTAGFTWRLPKGFHIGSEGTFTRNNQPGDGFYDTEYFVLNAEIGKKFLKTENLDVSLIGKDLLNQNINARREVSGNVITDYRTTIISRYFLMKVTWRFNNKRTKEKEDYGW